MQWISREREREREREKKDTKQLYKFLPQSGSSIVPLCTFKESSLKSISDYNCSSTKARDFKLLKHKSKRFPMLKHKRKIHPMLKHKSKRLLIKHCIRIWTLHLKLFLHRTITKLINKALVCVFFFFFLNCIH